MVGSVTRTKKLMPRASFFPRRESESQEHASPFSKNLPDIADFISESTGVEPCRPAGVSHIEDEPVSPSSSPRRSALTTRKPRLALDTVDEDGSMVQRANGQGKPLGLITSYHLAPFEQISLT